MRNKLGWSASRQNAVARRESSSFERAVRFVSKSVFISSSFDAIKSKNQKISPNTTCCPMYAIPAH